MSVGNDGSWSYEVGSCQAHKEGSLQNKIILKERSCLLKRKKTQGCWHTSVFIFMYECFVFTLASIPFVCTVPQGPEEGM